MNGSLQSSISDFWCGAIALWQLGHLISIFLSLKKNSLSWFYHATKKGQGAEHPTLRLNPLH